MKNSSTAFPLRLLAWTVLLCGTAFYASCGSSSSSTTSGSNTDSNWDSMIWDESNWA